MCEMKRSKEARKARERMLGRMVISLTAQVDAMKDRAEVAERTLEMVEVGGVVVGLQGRLDRLTKVAASRMGRLSVADDKIASLEGRLVSMEASRDHWARRAAELSDAAEIDKGGADV